MGIAHPIIGSRSIDPAWFVKKSSSTRCSKKQSGRVVNDTYSNPGPSITLPKFLQTISLRWPPRPQVRKVQDVPKQEESCKRYIFQPWSIYYIAQLFTDDLASLATKASSTECARCSKTRDRGTMRVENDTYPILGPSIINYLAQIFTCDLAARIS